MYTAIPDGALWRTSGSLKPVLFHPREWQMAISRTVTSEMRVTLAAGAAESPLPAAAVTGRCSRSARKRRCTNRLCQRRSAARCARDRMRRIDVAGDDGQGVAGALFPPRGGRRRGARERLRAERAVRVWEARSRPGAAVRRAVLAAERAKVDADSSRAVSAGRSGPAARLPCSFQKRRSRPLSETA
jgi:hypothetical protein